MSSKRTCVSAPGPMPSAMRSARARRRPTGRFVAVKAPPAPDARRQDAEGHAPEQHAAEAERRRRDQRDRPRRQLARRLELHSSRSMASRYIFSPSVWVVCVRLQASAAARARGRPARSRSARPAPATAGATAAQGARATAPCGSVTACQPKDPARSSVVPRLCDGGRRMLARRCQCGAAVGPRG